MGVHGVKAVFFDLDNTLVDTAAAGRRAIEEVVNALRSKHHCGEGEARGICDKVQAKLLKECHDPAKTCITDLRISHWEEAIQETIGGEANRSLAAECYFLWKATRLRHLTLAEDTRGMLTELRKAVRLLLLTNGDRQTQREKIEACACQPYFDAIVVGGEQKEEKPAPSIFHYCCDLLGVQPAECVMVGDSLDTDIQGGLNAGLRATVWLNKSMAAPADASPVPHYVISSVLDLPAVLQKIEHKAQVTLGRKCFPTHFWELPSYPELHDNYLKYPTILCGTKKIPKPFLILSSIEHPPLMSWANVITQEAYLAVLNIHL